MASAVQLFEDLMTRAADDSRKRSSWCGNTSLLRCFGARPRHAVAGVAEASVIYQQLVAQAATDERS